MYSVFCFFSACARATASAKDLFPHNLRTQTRMHLTHMHTMHFVPLGYPLHLQIVGGRTTMQKKHLDWSSLGFKYQPCDFSYVSNYKDGAWDEGGLTDDHSLVVSECAGIFHYCQEVFEGLKAPRCVFSPARKCKAYGYLCKTPGHAPIS